MHVNIEHLNIIVYWKTWHYVKSNQIKALLLSHHQQQVCRGEWNAWERAPDSAENNWHV